jgi:hypothetical protein
VKEIAAIKSADRSDGCGKSCVRMTPEIMRDQQRIQFIVRMQQSAWGLTAVLWRQAPFAFRLGLVGF